MIIRALTAGALIAVAVFAAPAPVLADEPRFALTPMGGYRGGGRFDEPGADRRLKVDGGTTAALALNLKQATDRYYELFYSRQRTGLDESDLDLNVDYLHAGGVLKWPQGGFSTFLAGGLGATRLSAGGFGSETRPSMSIGLGLEIPLAERFSIRLESRGYLTLTGGEREIFCVSGAEGALCRLRYDGDVLTQIEALAGLSFRF